MSGSRHAGIHSARSLRTGAIGNADAFEQCVCSSLLGFRHRFEAKSEQQGGQKKSRARELWSRVISSSLVANYRSVLLTNDVKPAQIAQMHRHFRSLLFEVNGPNDPQLSTCLDSLMSGSAARVSGQKRPACRGHSLELKPTWSG
ncbi:hypothetical protein L596_026756 [Steinernema carpocapsae]|uniref:Uncharacterized protein n=1 Tax=Steinernema carpocapsae TaxID=34508 RepID=A0A4U5M2C4_STECR|nr:hypothetical protein L596_026756 [Steinernema carpocapsae]